MNNQRLLTIKKLIKVINATYPTYVLEHNQINMNQLTLYSLVITKEPYPIRKINLSDFINLPPAAIRNHIEWEIKSTDQTIEEFKYMVEAYPNEPL